MQIPLIQQTPLRYSLETIDEPVGILFSLLTHCKVMTFTGPLGAGKTTLVKKLLERCGVKETVTSPTFTYFITYRNDAGETFYHFDLYRMKSLAEFREVGFDEYLYSPDSWAFIEWPEIIEPLLTHEVCKVTIDYYSDFERLLSYEIK